VLASVLPTVVGVSSGRAQSADLRVVESAPEVLFAAAPTLLPGDHMRHWAVITLQGTKAVEGDIPFEVSGQPSQWARRAIRSFRRL
jgi:hypothetical protein